MVDGKYDIEIDGQGFIVKKDSYNLRFDQPFVDQIANQALNYSDFSVWKAMKQGDYSGGFDFKRLDYSNVFYESSNIDIHYKNQEFRLSRALSDNLDEDTTIVGAFKKIVSFNGKWYGMADDTVYESPTGNAGSFSLENDCGSTIVDAVVFDNKLFVTMGANGYWYFDGTTWTQESDGSQPSPGNNEKIAYVTTFTPGVTTYIYGTYNNILWRGEWNDDDSQVDWTEIKQFQEDVTVYLTKPIVFNFNLYFWTKKESETLGSSLLYIHDGIDTIEVFPEDNTVATRMHVYQNRLYYVLFSKQNVFIKRYDGANVEEVKMLEGELYGFIYDSFTYTDLTGSPTGSGTLYDAGLATYSDPVHWASVDERLFMTISTTTPDNYLYEFSEKIGGWVRRNDFALSSNASYVLGIFANELYIGDDIGQVFKLTTNYEDSGYLVTSSNDVNVIMADKIFKEIELVVDPMPQGTNISVAYDLEDSGNYITVNMPTIVGGQTNIIVPLSNGSTNVVGKKIRLKITLTTNDTQRSPVVKDIVTRYYATPDSLWRWQMTLLCVDGLRLHDGVRETVSGRNLMNVLRNMKETKTVKSFKDLHYTSTTINKTGGIAYDDTTIPITDASELPTQGEVMCEDELIRYTGKSGNTLIGCIRGVSGTIAAAHDNGEIVDNQRRVLFHDVTFTDHNNNQTDGNEALAQVILYQA